MIKFTGRSSLKQYMPMKPIKHGIKVWVLGDNSNGYFCDFQIYTGKQNGTAEKGLGARVVKDLTMTLKGKHHHVYFDNYFTSYSLLTDLEKDGIYSCGTCQKDRIGFPQELKKPSLPSRYVRVCVCMRACMCVYMCMCALFTFTRRGFKGVRKRNKPQCTQRIPVVKTKIHFLKPMKSRLENVNSCMQ